MNKNRRNLKIANWLLPTLSKYSIKSSDSKVNKTYVWKGALKNYITNRVPPPSSLKFLLAFLCRQFGADLSAKGTFHKINHSCGSDCFEPA